MLSTVLIWRHIALCALHWGLRYFKLVFNLYLRVFRQRLVRYDLSECHLNPYRTRMDAICISYNDSSYFHSFDSKSHALWQYTYINAKMFSNSVSNSNQTSLFMINHTRQFYFSFTYRCSSMASSVLNVLLIFRRSSNVLRMWLGLSCSVSGLLSHIMAPCCAYRISLSELISFIINIASLGDQVTPFMRLHSNK